MKIHYLQHVSFEELGYIEKWLMAHGHQISSTYLFEEQYTLPETNEIDALIILGGPMGVYDEVQYTWLAAEKQFIKHFIKTGKPILGICLGAQLLSVCLGGEVTAAPNKEIGWYPVSPTRDCAEAAPWFYELIKQQPVLFHWHGDRFSIPDSAVDLATTPANDHQAFIVNQNIIGLQFHLECTPLTVTEMLLHFDAEDIGNAYVQTPEYIAAHTGYCLHANELMDKILENLLASETQL